MERAGERRAALLITLTLLAVGCVSPLTRMAPDPGPHVPSASPAPPPPDPSPIYATLDRAQEVYLDGVAAIVSGDEVDGERLIAIASGEIEAAIEACAAISGCDTAHVFDTQGELLGRQTIGLKLQATRISELERSAAEDLEREPGTESFAGEVPQLDRGAAAVWRGGDLRTAIRLDPPVLAALDDWLTWMRPQLMHSWHNYAFLREQMAPVYEAAGMPEALLFGMLATESNGKVHAYSRAGAAGPLQFMSYTGRMYGLGRVEGRDLRLDPAEATRANAAYLADRLEEFDGDLLKALAAYNGGEGRLRRLHRRYPDLALWDSRIYYQLPRETRDYVPRVLAAAWLFMQPERYNLELPEHDTTIVAHTVDQPISLGEMTICLGQLTHDDGWFRTLRNLNPWIEPRDRLEPGDSVRVPAVLAAALGERCATDAALATARALHDANYPEQPEMIRYTVRRGDTLSRIARQFRCPSIRELAAINGIRAPRYTVRVGQVLKIPDCG